MYNSIKDHLNSICTDSFRVSALVSLLILFFLVQDGYAQSNASLGRYDGPYFFYADGDTLLVRVENGALKTQRQPKGLFSVTTEDGKHQFDVSRHPFVKPNWSYPSTEKIMVLSDPHGDFESFYAILKSQQVIGEHYEWIFGNNSLMIIGDVFDRGKDVLPIFWLIYKLEDEAAKQGGRVHFLLGNHEEMVLRGNYKYTQDKYKALADSIGKNYRDFWAMNTELGSWLQSKNTMEKIGDHLFVHAGLSTMMLDPQWSISAVNDTLRTQLFYTKEERQKSRAGNFLFGSEGPLWYRGMVRQEEKYNPLTESNLEKILDTYDAKRIYLGHTIFPEVTSFYTGRVVAVNVNNEANRVKGKSRGLLIEGERILLIYDDVTKNKVINE